MLPKPNFVVYYYASSVPIIKLNWKKSLKVISVKQLEGKQYSKAPNRQKKEICFLCICGCQKRMTPNSNYVKRRPTL